MTGSSRQDFLSHAFRFNNKLKEESMIEQLTERYQSVRHQHAVAIENLQRLEKELGKTRSQVYEMKINFQYEEELSTTENNTGM